MSEAAWETSHSVESNVSPGLAWSFMTNVANWDDPPATFELEGPFEAGTNGTTRFPGQEPRRWRIAQVNAGSSYELVMPLDGATISVEWRFGAREGGGSELSQRIVLRGENAEAYVEPVRQGFGSNLAAGMSRIAAAMERAAAPGVRT